MITPNGTRAVATVLTATALAGLLAIPGTARAAAVGTRATASMTFQSVTVTAGTHPEVTFITSGTPAGAVVYLQEEGAGQPWRSIGRIRATSGSVRALADQAGRYEYRLVVASAAGSVVVASAPEALTVTNADGSVPSAQASAPAPAGQAASAQTGGGCTVCRVANDALPWLALIVDPASVWGAITSVLSAVGGAILAFLGL